MLPQRTVLACLVAVSMLCAGAFAHADLSKKVQKEFKGKILVTDNQLPLMSVDDSMGTVKLYKKLSRREVQNEQVQGVASWTFYYTAFFKQPSGVSEVSFDFHKADKSQAYVANKRFGVDPKLSVMSGMLTITEDDGPNPGTTYDVVVRGKRGQKEVELARTRLKLQ